MRILVYSHYFWPETFRINALTRALVERGHVVTVVTPIPNYHSGKFFEGFGVFERSTELVEGVRVFRVPVIPRWKGTALSMAANYLSAAFFASLLGPFRAGLQWDVIFVYQPSPVTTALPALWHSLLSRAPVVHWIQDLWPETPEATGHLKSPFLLKALGALVRLIYRGCDRILISSRAFRSRVESCGVAAEDIEYFPDFAEPLFRPISPEDAPDERAMLPDGFLVMFAGNIGEAQDMETLLAAAEITRKTTALHWIVIGDGSRYDWLREQVAERDLSDTVHMLGRHPLERMPYFFAHADALLVMLKKHSVFSLTVPAKVEAYMASGKPIIAALDGEGGRIVEEAHAGLVSPSEDYVALAANAQKLYEMSKDERVQFGHNGLAYGALHFDRVRLLDQLERVFESVERSKES